MAYICNYEDDVSTAFEPKNPATMVETNEVDLLVEIGILEEVTDWTVSCTPFDLNNLDKRIDKYDMNRVYLEELSHPYIATRLQPSGRQVKKNKVRCEAKNCHHRVLKYGLCRLHLYLDRNECICMHMDCFNLRRRMNQMMLRCDRHYRLHVKRDQECHKG